MKRYTLFTNIDFAFFNELRLDLHALLIEREVELLFDRDKKQTRLRGFGNDSAWQVFSLWMPPEIKLHVELKSWDTSKTANMILEGDKLKPLMGGCDLVLNDYLRFRLNVENAKKPLDIFEGDCITEVWEELDRRTKTYHQAPNRPQLMWVRNEYCK